MVVLGPQEVKTDSWFVRFVISVLERKSILSNCKRGGLNSVVLLQVTIGVEGSRGASKRACT